MKAKILILGGLVFAIVCIFLLRQEKPNLSSRKLVFVPINHTRADKAYSLRPTNTLGDILIDAQDPVFLNQVFPKFREFVAILDRLGLNPLREDLMPASCSKIRIIHIPNGIICPFVIGEGWTAEYTGNPFFSRITYFGQRGPDNPNRAISHADTNALSRLSRGAIKVPEVEIWKIANRVADAFGIDPSKFEKPEMFEEALFDYHLGIYMVQYRKKGSDPINGLNYTRSFSLKATSPTTAVLVTYSHLEAWLR